MNRLFTKRIGTLISALLIYSSVSFSQFENVDFLRGGPADGAKYLKAYVSPWANAFGSGLSGGWYNTAKPHKLGGFDITTNFNLGFVPSSAATFDASKIGLTTFTPSGTSPFTASTVAGPNTDGPTTLTATTTVAGNLVTLASFKTPPGSNWKILPVPTAQIGLGLPLGTEVKVRFIPKISIGGGDISLFGVGLLHSIIQYFPGNDLLPFDVSLFGGYTKLQSNIPLSLMPDTDPTIIKNYSTAYPATAFENQNLNININALNIGAIASLNLPVVTIYGGLGYCKTKTGLELSGNFPLPVPVALPLPHAEYNDDGVIKGTDFKDIDIENFSGLRANIGLRIKLAVITIHADYTRAQYNVFSTGLGISFR